MKKKTKDNLLMARCLVLLASEVLTEPDTNAGQRIERGRLIRALKRRLSSTEKVKR